MMSAAAKNSEGDLAHDSMTSDGFCENTDNETEHRSTPIEKLSSLIVFRTDLICGSFLIPAVIRS